MSRGEHLSPQRGGEGPKPISLPPEDVDHGGGTPWQLVVPVSEEVRVPPSVTPFNGDTTTANPGEVSSDDHFIAVEWGLPTPKAQERIPTAEEIERDGRRAQAIALYNKGKKRRGL